MSPENLENIYSPNLPRSLVREGCQVIGHDLLESNFQPEDTGRKLLLLLDLENVNNMMEGGASIDSMLQLGMKAAARNTGAAYVSLILRDIATGEWTVAATHGALAPAIINVCHQIAKTDCYNVFTSHKSAMPVSDRLTVDGYRVVFLCTPVTADGHLAGCITFVKTGQAPFDLKEVTLALMINQWSSIKLTNAGLLKQLQVQREHEQKLLSKICQSQIEERRRVASELHDTIAQWLVSAAYDVDACQLAALQKNTGAVDQELQRVKDILQRSIGEVRRIIANLRPPPIIDLGLMGAINQVAQALIKDGTECVVVSPEELPKLSMAEENTIFWIVQEAINNIKKHSAATSASIEFIRRGDSLAVEVSDNGKGFDTEKILNGTTPLLRVGISGMMERAELLGGTLNVVSRPGFGTNVGLVFTVKAGISLQMAVA